MNDDVTGLVSPPSVRPAESLSPAAQLPEPVQETGPVGASRISEVIDRIGVTRSHKMILLLVTLGAFFDIIEQNTIGMIGPSLKDQWGISNTQIGLLGTATFGSMYVGAVLGGWLSDIAGRRVMFSFNLAIYSLGGLICALAPNYEVLFAGRLIVGLGLGGELAVGLALLAELNPTKFRASAVALNQVGAGGFGNPIAYGFGFVVIGLVGPALPIMLGGPGSSWRWVLGLLALPALLVLYIRRYLPETPRYLVSKGRIDEANRSLSILARGRLNPAGLLVTPYLAPEAAVTNARTDKVKPSEIFQGRLARHSIVLAVCASMLFGGTFVVMSFMPVVLIDRGYDIATSLAFTMIMNLGSLLGAASGVLLNARLPRRRVIGSGALLSCAMALSFGFLAHSSAAVLLIGFGFQFFLTLTACALSTWVPELYPTRVRAFGTGVISNLGSVAGAVLPPVAGALLAAFGAPGLLVLIAVMYFIVAIAVRFGPETHGRSLEELHGEYVGEPAAG